MGIYSFAGDLLAIILCIMSGCVLKFAYTAKRVNLKLFCWALFIITCSSIQNMFVQTMLNQPIETLLEAIIFFTFQNSVMIGLSVLLLIMQEYVLNLAIATKKEKIQIRCLFWPIIAIYTCFKFYSPLHGIDVYYDEVGQQIVNYGLQDNLFVYVYSVLAIGTLYLVLKHRKRMIPSAFYTIMASSLLSFIIMVISFYFNIFTFVCFSYVLPVLAVLITYHHHTQDMHTGALDLQAYKTYMEEARHLPLVFFHLRVDQPTIDQDQQLAKSFSNYIREMFEGTKYQLFRIAENEFILIYLKTEMTDNALTILEARVKMGLDLLQHKWKTNYSLTGIDTANVTSISSVDFLDLTRFLLKNETSVNKYRICFDDDAQDYLTYTLLKSALENIVQSNNLDDERIILYFQPIVDSSNECRRAEALLRLKINNKVFHPKQYLSIIHEMHCEHFITKMVLNKVCQYIKQFEAEGFDYDKISINVFPEDLIEDERRQNLIHIVEEIHNMNFDHIAFEILETAGAFDSDKLVKSMIVLKSITSIEFYLDDYGTGFSNLLRLLLLPISVIKFDRQILWGARNNQRALATAKTSIETFKNLDLKIVMEGVATPEDLEICKELGVDYYQGFELAKPGDWTILLNFFKKAEQ